MSGSRLHFFTYEIMKTLLYNLVLYSEVATSVDVSESARHCQSPRSSENPVLARVLFDVEGRRGISYTPENHENK
jgi:hypothetical protein